LDVLVESETGITIGGRTGSGKTEIFKALVGFIPNDLNITLIEDTRDSHIKNLYPEKNIFSWRTLIDREKPVTHHDLIKAALRNNPDWLCPAETRGSEAYDMLQAAMTDHAILTTLHATGAGSIVSRLLSMIGQHYRIDENRIGKDIVEYLPFGVHMVSKKDKKTGVRTWKINELVEFENYLGNGQVKYRSLYKVSKTYDKKTGKYSEKIIINPLSEKQLQRLTDLELLHKLPAEYRGE